MRTLRALLLLLCLTALTALTAAGSYRRYTGLTSARLYRMGTEPRPGHRSADSAMVCLTILANRYRAQMPDSEKLPCAKARAAMGRIFFFRYFDYPKAMENTVRALEIMEETGAELPEAYLTAGLIHCSIGESAQDRRTTLTAIDYMRKAFRAACRQGDTKTMNTAFGNIVSQAYKTGQIRSTDTEWRMFRERAANGAGDSEYTQFNRLLYEGITLIRGGHYDRALEKFDRQTDIMPADQSHARYIAGAWEYKAMVHAMRKDWPAAIDCSHQLERLVTQFDMKDARVETYRMLARYYNAAGQQGRSQDYTARYLSLKDTLLNYRQVASMDEMRYLREMRRIDRQMEEMRRDRRTMRAISIAVLAVTVATLLFTRVVYRKNKRLRKANESLYKKNEEARRAEENERRQCHDYERQLAELRHIMESGLQANRKTQAGGAKYRGSSLSEESKDRLLARIMAVMENTTEICRTDFSSQRLTELVGVQYKYVSQVINEKYNSNFNNFLSDFRIK